ncbi:unnamed protein product [Fraxinus pennsylvanica]|uniref:Ubiquitin-like protease family profile domain-containing protein n=1 Tax=Fraxinus pennsylvanica TaxID=56036 RepID=A0AAD1ZA89_9LAMI|nr:unnamed protein product [Fraxinus pennsylvanica]
MDSNKNTSSMGSVWIRLDDKRTSAVVVSNRRLSMGSIKTHQAVGSSKSSEISEPKNELSDTPSPRTRSSKSYEICEPKNYLEITPYRRITRSFTTSSQSNVSGNRLSVRRLVNTDFEWTGTKNPTMEKGKMPVEEEVPDDSRVTAADLDKMLYDLDQVKVTVIQPSEVEIKAGYFVGLHIKEPAFKSVDTLRTDHDVVKVNLHDVKGKKKKNMSKGDFVHCSKRNIRDISDQREPHQSYERPHDFKIVGELQFHVLDLQDKQNEIINLHNDLKTDIQRVERFVEDKYRCLMEEIRRNTHSDNHDYGNASTDISKKKSAAMETKAREDGGYGNTPNNNVEMFAMKDDNNLPHQTVHAVVGEKSSKTIELATDTHDDIHFTEEDLIQVDNIVNSVHSMKHKSILQHVLRNDSQPTGHANMYSKKLFHLDTTPNYLLEKSRPVVCGVLANPKAPMMDGEPAQNVILLEPGDENNSNEATPTKKNNVVSIHPLCNTVGLINTPVSGTNLNTNYRMYAIKEGMAPPHIDDFEAFENWFQDGFKSGQTTFKFPPSKDILNPPLQFGPYMIDRKTWWYELRQPNVCMRDTHLNVCFYYFRKMVKFRKVISFNGTTTDSFFGSMVRAAYKACSKDINAISNFRLLVEYAKGEYMHCNTRWADVDNVIIPIMMDKKAHWILGQFDIKRRFLNVYNPNRLTISDRMVFSDIEAFAYVLPCLMFKINAWQASPADRIGLVTPLDVNIITDIPQNDNGQDCGLYVIRFAEYIINGVTDKASWMLDPIKYRTSLASQLLKHGCEKVIEAYDTDFDLVPRSVRRKRKMKGLMIE